MTPALTGAQREVLEVVRRAGTFDRATGTYGVRPSNMLSRDHRRLDRLIKLGLCEPRFVLGEGCVYFITDAGRAILSANDAGRLDGERDDG